MEYISHALKGLKSFPKEKGFSLFHELGLLVGMEIGGPSDG
jgi:hypothetical protein